MWGRSTRSRSSVNLPERRRALTGSVSAGNVDLSNWAGNLTGRFIKVLTQNRFDLRCATTIGAGVGHNCSDGFRALDDALHRRAFPGHVVGELVKPPRVVAGGSASGIAA